MSLSSDLERLLTLWHQEMGFLDTKCSANAFLSELRTIGTWGDLHSTQQTHLFTIQNNVLFTAASSQGINHKAPDSSCKQSKIQGLFFLIFCHDIEDILCLVLKKEDLPVWGSLWSFFQGDLQFQEVYKFQLTDC